MGENGYTYPNSSAYNTLGSRRDEPLGPAIRKPFVPFVPNSNRNPEDYVTRKTVVPVATSPYGNEYSRHGSPTRAYRTRDDEEEYWRRQTSPVHSRPQRFTPAATTEWRASPQSTAYNGATGYGDYGNREGRRPVGSPVRNDNYYGNGYGHYANYNGKEWHEPSGCSIRDRNDCYDGYQPAVSYSSGPKNSSGWTAPPRNGIQLSEPTNDIGKALGLLKEVARLNGHGDYGNKGRPKDEGYNYYSPKHHF